VSYPSDHLPHADEKPVQPFSSTERERLRRLLDAFSDVQPEDVAECVKIARSGKLVRALVIGSGKFVMWLGGLGGLIVVVQKLFFTKGGP
jgi:hypothetical protein